jgi:hypothetical protein
LTYDSPKNSKLSNALLNVKSTPVEDTKGGMRLLSLAPDFDGFLP